MKNAIDTRVTSPHLRHLSLIRHPQRLRPRESTRDADYIAHVELNLGGYGIEGGMHQPLKALYRIAKNNGTMFRMGSLVQRINTHKNKVVSISYEAGNDELDYVKMEYRHFTNPFALKRTLIAHPIGRLHVPPLLTICCGTTQTHLKEHHTRYSFLSITKTSSSPYLRTAGATAASSLPCDQTLNHGTQHPLGGHIVFGMINAPEVNLEDQSMQSQKTFETMAMIAKTESIFQ